MYKRCGSMIGPCGGTPLHTYPYEEMPYHSLTPYDLFEKQLVISKVVRLTEPKSMKNVSTV